MSGQDKDLFDIPSDWVVEEAVPPTIAPETKKPKFSVSMGTEFKSPTNNTNSTLGFRNRKASRGRDGGEGSRDGILVPDKQKQKINPGMSLAIRPPEMKEPPQIFLSSFARGSQAFNQNRQSNAIEMVAKEPSNYIQKNTHSDNVFPSPPPLSNPLKRLQPTTTTNRNGAGQSSDPVVWLRVDSIPRDQSSRIDKFASVDVSECSGQHRKKSKFDSASAAKALYEPVLQSNVDAEFQNTDVALQSSGISSTTMTTSSIATTAATTTTVSSPPTSWLVDRLLLGGMSEPLAQDCDQKLVHTEGFSNVIDFAACPVTLFHSAYLTSIGITGLGTQRHLLRLHSELQAQYVQSDPTKLGTAAVVSTEDHTG